MKFEHRAQRCARLRNAFIGVLALVALASGALAGCSSTASHPQTAIEQYVDDVRAKRVEAVYSVLGEKLRGEMTLADFQAFFADNYDEILAQAEELVAAANDGRLEITAELDVGEHAELALRYEKEQWLLTEELPSIAGASSPRGTLAALGQAMETQDFGALMMLLSKEKSDTLRAEFEILRSGLSSISEDDIVIYGETATVYLDWGLKLELLYENGSWRVHRLLQQ